MPAFEFVLETCPDQFRPEYKVKGSKWITRNGSEIQLIGIDRHPNKMRGNKVSGVIIDEAGYTDNLLYLYNSVIIPATTHCPDAPIIFASSSPSTPAHEFDDLCQMAELVGGYVELDIYKNPLLNKQDHDRLAAAVGGYESTTFRREYLCHSILDDNLALVKEWKDEYIQEAIKDQYFHFYHKYVAMDLGRKDHTALLFGYYDFRQAKLFIQDELTMYGPDWTTITLKDAILPIENNLWGDKPPFRRISDNNNPHLIQDLSSLHNLHFSETNKESLEAMVNEVRMMVGNGQVIIDPKCKMLIGCMKLGIWDKHRKGFSRSRVYGHFDHFASLVYLIRNLAKNSNPIPIDYGHDHRSFMEHIKGDIGKSNNARTLEKLFSRKGDNHAQRPTPILGISRRR